MPQTGALQISAQWRYAPRETNIKVIANELERLRERT